MINDAEKIGAKYALISSGLISLFLVYLLWGSKLVNLSTSLIGIIIFLVSSHFSGKWSGRKIAEGSSPWLIGYFSTFFSSIGVLLFYLVKSLFFESSAILGAVVGILYILIVGSFIMLIIGSIYGYILKRAIAKSKLDNLKS